MGHVNKLLLAAAAPLLGMALAAILFCGNPQSLLIPLEQTSTAINRLNKDFESLQASLGFIVDTVLEQEERFRQQEENLGQITQQVTSQKIMSDQLYEERILAMLGEPVQVHKSKRVEIKIFKLDELGYRGYIAKLKLFDPSALKVVLAKDKLGEKETTPEAVKRTGAIFGINGGGFYTEMRDGSPYAVHIGNVVINGKLISPFNAYPGNLFFAGIDKTGKFMGGMFSEEAQLMGQNPWQGVSFVPILIKGGMVRPIEADWAETKHPRTIIGEYANGDLIMIVVDGRQDSWSSGVTLERLLEKLVELGVKEGYNLDGGGSSTMVYKGAVLNRPSDGKPRPVVTNIVVMP